MLRSVGKGVLTGLLTAVVASAFLLVLLFALPDGASLIPLPRCFCWLALLFGGGRAAAGRRNFFFLPGALAGLLLWGLGIFCLAWFLPDALFGAKLFPSLARALAFSGVGGLLGGNLVLYRGNSGGKPA